jgi:hypothetical protein
VTLKPLYTSLNALAIFHWLVGLHWSCGASTWGRTQGLPLTKNICLSGAFLPSPTTGRDICPTILTSRLLLTLSKAQHTSEERTILRCGVFGGYGRALCGMHLKTKIKRHKSSERFRTEYIGDVLPGRWVSFRSKCRCFLSSPQSTTVSRAHAVAHQDSTPFRRLIEH